MLWLVLHHDVFSFLELPKEYERYTSGFLDYIANSGAMKTEPKYLVFKESFELDEEEIDRQHRIGGLKWCLLVQGLPQVRKMVLEKILQGHGKVTEFYLESGKIDLFEEKSGKIEII